MSTEQHDWVATGEDFRRLGAWLFRCSKCGDTANRLTDDVCAPKPKRKATSRSRPQRLVIVEGPASAFSNTVRAQWIDIEEGDSSIIDISMAVGEEIRRAFRLPETPQGVFLPPPLTPQQRHHQAGIDLQNRRRSTACFAHRACRGALTCKLNRTKQNPPAARRSRR